MERTFNRQRLSMSPWQTASMSAYDRSFSIEQQWEGTWENTCKQTRQCMDLCVCQRYVHVCVCVCVCGVCGVCVCVWCEVRWWMMWNCLQGHLSVCLYSYRCVECTLETGVTELGQCLALFPRLEHADFGVYKLFQFISHPRADSSTITHIQTIHKHTRTHIHTHTHKLTCALPDLNTVFSKLSNSNRPCALTSNFGQFVEVFTNLKHIRTLKFQRAVTWGICVCVCLSLCFRHNSPHVGCVEGVVNPDFIRQLMVGCPQLREFCLDRAFTGFARCTHTHARTFGTHTNPYTVLSAYMCSLMSPLIVVL